MYKFKQLIVVMAFLAAQSFALAHMASHGFLDHKHHNKICDVSCHMQVQHGAAETPIAFIAPASSSSALLSQLADAFHLAAVVSAHRARAPPARLA